MSDNSRFRLIFEQLDAACKSTSARAGKDTFIVVNGGEATIEEMDEIDRLRQIVLEVTEPTPMSYTTT